MRCLVVSFAILAAVFLFGCGGGGADGNGNTRPVADAGPDQTVTIGTEVTLNGNNSTDMDGDSLTCSWDFTSKPSGSTATLSDPSAFAPVFTPDVDGIYELALIVNDGKEDSTEDTVTIMATMPPGVGDRFPIAISDNAELSFGASFDGTNYLVALGVEEVGSSFSSSAQVVGTDGSLVGPVISSGCSGVALGSVFDGTNHLLVGGDCDNENNETWGRFVSPSGVANGNFLITEAGAEGTGIAFGGGKYLFAYTRPVDDKSKVYGKFIDPEGNMGSEITISTGYGSYGSFNVAFDGNRFLVVWTDETNYYEIKGRFVSTAGILSDEFTVNASPALSHDPLTVAFGSECYLVVWRDKENNETEDNLYGQLVDTAGNLVGNVIPIGDTPGNQALPSIAFDGTNYLVAWLDNRNNINDDDFCDPGEGSCADVYGQYIGTDGTPVGAEFIIDNSPGEQVGWVVGFNGWKYLVLINDGVILHDPLTWSDVYGVFVTP